MRPTDSLLGRRFGKLVVTGFSGYFPTSLGAPLTAYWTCKCDCGVEMRRVKATSLLRGNTKSCGCLARQKKNERHLRNKWYYEKSKGAICAEWVTYAAFESFMSKCGYTSRMRVKKKRRDLELSPDNFYFA